MPITDLLIDQAYSDLKRSCGGVRNDYFGLLYLEQEHDVPRGKAVNQVAFGGNDYGLDGFHFDPTRRNLYLFQFKYSDSPAQFKGTLQRLIDIGMERIFLTPNQDDAKNQLLLQLRSCLIENRQAIDQVFFRFVFTGDPAEAENSKVLDKLREDLEDKKYLIDKFFHDRQVTLVVEFRTPVRVGTVADHRHTRVYPLAVTDVLLASGPGGEAMHVGFVRLADLHAMHAEMGPRFFERNIRYGLGSNESVNRVLGRAFKQIVLEGKLEPAAFAFNHNGITLSAQQVEHADGFLRVTEPRLLNGAQTVTTLAGFLKANADNPVLAANRTRLDEIKVLCRVIAAPAAFVTAVTISNNRQNPVEPWNLRANDMIQLELQDQFAKELGVYYERQENAFASLSYEELEETGITEGKAVELVRLAQTLLASDGQIDKFARFREVFEDEKVYDAVFSPKRLEADFRHVLLCYKIQFRLKKLANEITAKGPNKYQYLSRGRLLLWSLLCQGVLNHPDLDDLAERFGRRMSIETDYTEVLSALATTRCRPLLSDLTADPDYAEKVAADNLGFLRTNAAYKRCMEFAYKKWKWVEKKLR